MAKIVFASISAGQIDDFAVSDNYQTTVLVDGVSVANPESKLQFLERRLRAYMEGQMAHGKKLGRQATRATQDASDVAAAVMTPGEITV